MKDGYGNRVPCHSRCLPFILFQIALFRTLLSTHQTPHRLFQFFHYTYYILTGIPKFYRWLSERYPLVNQPGGATVIPVIDNFYLDMNGIVHNCTHGNDPDTKLTEEEMIKKIFMYLDKLFHIVKPQKLMFMAVDGVAPRAKMNQQRARRFKTAREAAQRAAEAAGNPEELSSAEPFDSNCITPGTPFMERLAEHLRFFVRHKIADDPLWQVPTIVFSGHDVPGEGEHKVMEYIRLAKKSPEYEPNLRHCLYGLDADLIMLSLVTHEPHFCLLREIVSYKNKGQPIREALENPSQEHFVLLQIGLLRDYVHLEFEMYEKTLPFAFDLERIIDDFVLFCMLVGNDFLPSLPTCDINEGSLDLMFSTYKTLLPRMGGYLTHAGSLHRGRLELFLRELAKYEAETLEQRATDAEDYESKMSKRSGSRKLEEAFTSLDTNDVATPMDFAALETLEAEGHELELLAVVEEENQQKEEKVIIQQEPTMMSKEARKFFEQGDREQGLLAWKERYYREKLKSASQEERRKVVHSFIEGLHWVLEYYYRGVASWDWYYPYHYAPMVSDLVDLSSIEVSFTPGRPFLPYEQLMAVQPASSCKLLPEPYRHLMTDQNSPIHDFYPVDFLVDTEGKRAEWEGVVQIPFIDEERLIKAIQTVPEGTLTDAERKRNKAGSIIIFKYDSKSQEKSFCRSTLPHHYSDVVRCNSSAKSRPAPPPLPKDEKGFEPILVRGTKTGIATIAGFPTLRTLAVYGKLEKAGVDVFGMRSRKDSLILNFKNLTQGIDERLLTAKGISKAVLKQRAWVSWPYVKESIVEKISDAMVTVSSNASENKTNGWEIDVANMKKEYLSKYGVDLGNVRLLIHVRPIEGLIRQVDGSVEKRFGKETKAFPLQMTLRKNPAPDPRYDPNLMKKERSVLWYDFKVGSKALFLGKAYYGCTARIIYSETLGEHKSVKSEDENNKIPAPDNTRYRVTIEGVSESSAAIQAAAKRVLPSMQPQYIPSGKVSRILGVSPRALGRITGNFWVRTGSGRNDSVDIGLYVKDGKNSLVVPDFSASIESPDPNKKTIWAYSDALISVLKSYKQNYPFIWAVLDEEKVTVETLFPGMEKDNAIKELLGVKAWLSSLPSAKRKLVKSSSIVASEDAIRIFQASLPSNKKQSHDLLVEMESVPPAMLLPPIEPGGLMAAFSGGSFSLGDRIVSAGSSGVPPFGSRGTVIGVHESFLEVLFDLPFEGGSNLGGRCHGSQGAVVAPSSLLNLSRPHAVSAGASQVIQHKNNTKQRSESSDASSSQGKIAQPKIPDGSSRGFGMGRGKVPGPHQQPTAGMNLLGQLQGAGRVSHPIPPPPMPSSKLISPDEHNQSKDADAMWQLLGGKK